ncbi:MAG: tRNA 4-thiouridine(8) synthase ThiI [Planctomycetes bacterium]|nr:tRNA 4-thiouridine(8) synthase ThiI [Planctomycetota bacterium]
MNGAERVVIVRYGEIGLKGGNRGVFEQLLKRRLADALRGEQHGHIERPHGRVLVRAAADPWAAAERAARVFGVTSASPALAAPADPQALEAAAAAAVEEALARRGSPDGRGLTMKVESKRADKGFPLDSMELSRRVADAVLGRFRGFGVRMKSPDLTVGIEVRAREALVFAERLRGPGGLPVGSLGRAVALLSGGIDSPVAAWLALKRGLLTELLHFHAPPFVGEASREKALDLARALSRYGGRLRLWIAPFSAVQVAIRNGAPDPYRTLLYRRAMNRVAVRRAPNSSSNKRA